MIGHLPGVREIPIDKGTDPDRPFFKVDTSAGIASSAKAGCENPA